MVFLESWDNKIQPSDKDLLLSKQQVFRKIPFQWKMHYKADPLENKTYGAKISTYKNKQVLEISNDGTDTYFKLGNIFGLTNTPNAINKNPKLTYNIQLYPNPSETEITIRNEEFNEKNENIIRITDMQGRIISQQMLTQQIQTIIDISSLKCGFYIVEINKWRGTLIKK